MQLLGGLCGKRGSYDVNAECNYNNITTTGLYTVNSNNNGLHSNVPVSRNTRATLIVLALSNYMSQIWIDTYDKSNISMYIRGHSDNAWGAWKQVTLT